MIPQKPRLPVKEILLYGFLPSFLKVLVYKMKGAKIGKNVYIGLGSVIIGDNIAIGDDTSIGMLTIIRGKKIEIGRFVKIGSTSIIDTERIEIGDDTKINEQVFIGGLSCPDSYIKIGKRVIIMQMSFLNPMKPLIIGDDTGIGGHCLIFTHGSWSSVLDGYPVSFAPVTIGKNVWLPWRVFVMPGVSIGDGAVIGANSLVSKNIPAHTLAAGSPAKVLKENFPAPLTEENKKTILENIINEFIVFTNHNNIKEEQIINDLDGKHILFKNIHRNNIHELNYTFNANCERKPSKNDNLLIINNSQNISSNIHNGYKMVLDLHKKERIGTSELGEEFVQFIARYGIRFNRLD